MWTTGAESGDGERVVGLELRIVFNLLEMERTSSDRRSSRWHSGLRRRKIADSPKKKGSEFGRNPEAYGGVKNKWYGAEELP